MNASFIVRFEEIGRHGTQQILLRSPDLASPRKAHARARKAAKERLVKKGLKVKILGSECVG